MGLPGMIEVLTGYDKNDQEVIEVKQVVLGDGIIPFTNDRTHFDKESRRAIPPEVIPPVQESPIQGSLWRQGRFKILGNS